ncbi:MAG: hypothetical protein WDZ41_00595 [Candidatus Babeliales bacterium]
MFFYFLLLLINFTFLSSAMNVPAEIMTIDPALKQPSTIVLKIPPACTSYNFFEDLEMESSCGNSKTLEIDYELHRALAFENELKINIPLSIDVNSEYFNKEIQKQKKLYIIKRKLLGKTACCSLSVLFVIGMSALTWPF